jgi:hypothetical protein
MTRRASTPHVYGQSNLGFGLSFAKILAGRRISDIQAWFGAQSAITLAHGQPVFDLVRSTRSPFS